MVIYEAKSFVPPYGGGTEIVMNDNYGILTGAKWIGKKPIISNPMSLDRFIYKLRYRIVDGNTAGIVIAARNKDNYTLIEINCKKQMLHIYDICDNAWKNAAPTKSIQAVCNISDIRDDNYLEIQVDGHAVTIIHNEEVLFDHEEVFPRSVGFTPHKCRLMMIGFYQPENTVEYRDIELGEPSADKNGYKNIKTVPVREGLLAPLGKIENGVLIVSRYFDIASVVPASNLVRSFEIKGDVKKATLYASARGFYNAYVNGERAGDRYYTPGFTDYRLRITYQSYDVTGMLRVGENHISAVIGSGYYSGFAGYNRFANVYGAENSFIAKLIVEYENGETEEIITDDSWDHTDNGVIVYADYLQGEYFDARNDEKRIWTKAEILAPPNTPKPTNGDLDGLEFKMEEDNICGAREVMRLNGEYLGEIPEGHRIYDMAQNMVGTVAIRLRGRRGQGIKVRYGEMLLKTGELYVANLRAAANTDVYIIKGDPDGELFVPDLTAHGFRYVEITGNGCGLDNIEIESVTGIVISNAETVTGGFECSNPLINKLYSNIVWGQRDNYLLVPTDCPQRNERMGWTGDAQVFAKTAAYNFDIYDFMRKWLKDMREAQLMYNKNGSVPDIVPMCGDNRGGCGGWADAAVIVPWELYRAYGKKEILEENYEMMKAWVEFQNSPENRYNGLRTVNGREVPEQSDLAATPYIQIQQSRGDHLTYDRSTPFILSATAYAAHSATVMVRTAKVLGKKEDEKRYSDLFEIIKKAFCEAWVEEDGTLSYWGEMSFDDVNRIYYSDMPGSKNHPSQTAYALTIDFGLIDPNEYPRAAECFRQAIAERDGKLSSGFLGISHLAPALTKCGYNEDAFRLLEQTENPSWLYSVINGATTIWERWNSYIAETGEFGEVSMNSFNHYAYGAIGQWMFGQILGINPAEPGYNSALLTPHYGGSMSYAKGWHMTPHGRIEVKWETKNGTFTYECTVPDEIEALLVMPNGDEYRFSGSFRAECPVS